MDEIIEIKEIQEKIKAYYEKGVLSITPDYVQVEPKYFKLTSEGTAIEASWCHENIELSCTTGAVKFITIV